MLMYKEKGGKLV